MASAQKELGREGYQQLLSELKAGIFHHAYAFYGKERYLLEFYRKELRKKLVSGPAEDFNYHRFTEENFSLEAFSDAINAIPMMSEYSLVELVDVDVFSQSTADCKILAEIFENLPEYCVLLLIYEDAEWKGDKLTQKRWAGLNEKLLQVEFSMQSEQALIPWIKKHLKTGNKTISNDLCRYLISLTGGSMTTLNAELEKLMCYTEEPEIQRADIDAIVIPVLEAAIYQLTDDILKKDFSSALHRLQTLMRQEYEPTAINGSIGTQLQQLYAAKLLQEHGGGAFDLTKIYPRVKSWQAKRIYAQAGSFHKPLLKRAMLICANTDYAIKTSGGDKEQLAQMMILRLAEACREGR